MNTIEFSYNWNKKLDCDYFTTLRLSDRFSIGEEVIITLKGIYKSRAIIVDKKETKLHKLNSFICGLDTGYNEEQTKAIIQKMYPKVFDWSSQKIYLYLIRKKK